MNKYKGKFLLGLGYILGITGLFLRILSFIPSITNSPFSIGWSEGGRIFAAYQVYAPIIADKHLSFPWLDPGRSILDGLVLLIPHLPIWVYRLWINILFLVLNFLAALLTIRKALESSEFLDKRKKAHVVLLILWGTLFLLQAPIYYHLLAGILPILWVYDQEHPVRNVIVVVFCSMWEALCRVNWFLMPATLAVLLHILKTPLLHKKILSYIKWPLIYMITGGVSSFGGYLIYMKAMGFVIPFLNPSMDYHFSMYKLWPNTGYMGLLLGIALISMPIIFIALHGAWKYRQDLTWIRLALVLGCLVIFFTGSTVVSIRAGGGYDLHNYDSFLLLIFITGCFLGMRAITLDAPEAMGKPTLINHGILILLLVIPILMAFPKTDTGTYRTTAQTEQVLMEIKQVLQNSPASNADHPILFIDQRQLLVFNLIKDEYIYVPYEEIELMEMAMARNEQYKKQVQRDLENHKFSLIVSDILVPWAKSYSPNDFDRDWYENNVWVDFAAIPVLDNYMPIYTNKDFGIAIYSPKE
jgi:hypothetical protein